MLEINVDDSLYSITEHRGAAADGGPRRITSLEQLLQDADKKLGFQIVGIDLAEIHNHGRRSPYQSPIILLRHRETGNTAIVAQTGEIAGTTALLGGGYHILSYRQ